MVDMWCGVDMWTTDGEYGVEVWREAGGDVVCEAATRF